ncbi:MAG: carbohydrate ABC transporter permease, partial [Clostridia bacterium]|nr:carbohydrate ABC transporter permease [Clostridia bacterium]
MNKIKRSFSDRLFDSCNVILQIIVAAVMLYPMLYVLFASFSDPIEFAAHKGMLWHSIGFNFNSYKAALKNPMLLQGYANTIFVLVFGVILNIILTTCGAYFLSRQGV